MSNKPLLLVVDDDPLISDALSYAFAAEYDIVTSHARPHCLALLQQLRRTPQAALVDLGLPPLPHRPDEGFALIGDLLARAPEMKIIVLSGQNGDDNARHARTLGAIEFVGKPCDPGHLLKLLRQALTFSATGSNAATASGLIGESLPMQRLRLQLAQYANLSFPILIEGESGSGKDVVASRCLHLETERRQQPFLALNCAAISPSLLEPTLFGHARGAFTGATTAKAGYFEEAGEGTLFLDEIGELPPDLQPKLLRVLENGEYQRVGETQTRISRARIVTATNRDLRLEIKAGRFRADLYHRLAADVPGGLLGAALGRGAPQVLRLSLAYAIADGADVVDVAHLNAAWAVWEYARSTAALIFPPTRSLADEIAQAVRAAGAHGVARSGLHALFGNHRTRMDLDQAVAELVAAGIVTEDREATGGRPRTVLRMVTP